MQFHCITQSGYDVLSADLICAAQFSVDSQWYRAMVIDLPGSQSVSVQYVDFGNTEVLPCHKLRKLKDTFTILPAQV